MKNKKVLALLVSLVLIVAVALPGTLAVSSDQDAVNSGFTVDTATPAPDTQELTGGQEQPIDPETPEPVLTCTCDPAPAEGEAHAEGCPLAPLSCTCDPAPLEGEAHKEGCPMTCTCTSQPLTGTIHKEGCPLYVAPLTCTCDPQPAEGEAHKEGCPLYGDPTEEKPFQALYDSMMAAATMDEFKQIGAVHTEEELMQFVQWVEENGLLESLQSHMDAIAPAPVVPETVVYTYAGPFMPPVEVAPSGSVN